jgi:hypothetical protein
LSPDEKKAALDSLLPEARDRFQARRRTDLEKFDADGDGKLNEQERRTARETVRERIRDRLDRNDDGRVGLGELWMGARRWHRHHGKGPGAGGPSASPAAEAGPRPGGA